MYREQRELVWAAIDSAGNKTPGKQCTRRKRLSPAPATVLQASREPIYHQLAHCRQQQAVSFYFGHFLPRVRGYWTDDLPDLYTKASPTSLLAKTATALASSIIAIHPNFSHFRLLAIDGYTQCLRLVRKALKDPSLAKTDETLVSVIMLGTYEVRLKELNLFIRGI